MEVHPIGSLFIVFSLIIMNALITAAQTAIEYVNKSEAEKRASEGNKRAQTVLYLQRMPGYYIYIFRFLILILSIIYSVLLVKGILLLVFSYVFIVFSVLYPKKLAIYYADRYAYSLSGILKTCLLISKPLLWIVEKNNNLIIRITGIDPLHITENVTEDEIISIVNEGHEQGVLEAEEAEMISNIIVFDEKEASDIMTHRMKIAAVDSIMTIEEAFDFMLNEKYTRFPLYQDNIDNVIGVIHLRDVMLYYKDPELRKLNIIEAARKPYFIPDTQNIDVLFHDMQSKKVHMAIAFDEYGQTAGLVTMEDILEEIVGDIQDEYDDELDQIISTSNKDEYIVKGEAGLEELADIAGIVFDEEDYENYETVNGFIISKLEHIPNEDEIIQIEYYGFCFDIEEIKNKVIQKVRVYRLPNENNSNIKAAAVAEEDVS